MSMSQKIKSNQITELKLNRTTTLYLGLLHQFILLHQKSHRIISTVIITFNTSVCYFQISNSCNSVNFRFGSKVKLIQNDLEKNELDSYSKKVTLILYARTEGVKKLKMNSKCVFRYSTLSTENTISIKGHRAEIFRYLYFYKMGHTVYIYIY